MLDIEPRGLDEAGKRILKLIIDHYEGAPVLEALAVALSEEAHTLEEVYEPYLIM